MRNMMEKKNNRKTLSPAILAHGLAVLCLGVASLAYGSTPSTSFPAKRDTLKGAPTDSVADKYDKWKHESEVRRLHLTMNGSDTLAMNSLDTLDMSTLRHSPYLSLQQWLKGQSAGLYVQEPSGEPGTMQSMLLRGVSAPLFSKTSIFESQPAVFINGVPVAEDRFYSSVIQTNDVNPLGTVTNLLAGVDLNNIVSLEVIKDPLKLALLGPLAANGAIWIVTKDGYYGGKHVSVEAGITIAAPTGKVRMTNAADERAFRAGFYPTLGKGELDAYLPAYLRNQSDPYFFGSPGWADDYYKNIAPQFNINASIGGGQRTANYLFTVGTTTSAGVADDTKYNKYNVSFYLNILPFTGCTVSTVLQAAKAGRSRNMTLRDRYAEVEYLPSLSTPIAPTAGAYGLYRSYADETIDDNDNVALNGSLLLDYVYHGLHANVGLKFDYETNVRHVFWPSYMMEDVNYVSDYSAYNRRLIGETGLGYDFTLGDFHSLSVNWKGTLQEDRYHYNYGRGYDGDDDKKPTTNGGNYIQYRFLDQEVMHLLSSAFSIDYKYSDWFNVGLLFRYDGTSAVQSDDRWLFTPAASLGLNLKNLLLKRVDVLSALNLRASWARMGRLLSTDRFSLGTQYTSDNIGWNPSFIVGSYNGLASISRPYNSGWIGYGIGWPYSEKTEIGLDGALWNNRLRWNVALYSDKEKDLMLQLPVVRELGYSCQYRQGMEITNRGVELSLSGTLISGLKGWDWEVGGNFAYNKNELSALPDGLTEVEVNNRLLKVGEPVDCFYLLQNDGIYTDASQIPQADGKLLSVNGVPFGVNDPKWKDVNGDNRITDADKVMTGNSLPQFTGGFNTRLSYKNFDLSAFFYFALGHEAVNYRAYQQYDFATLDNANTLDAVKEIFFWQNGNLPLDYPRYNALSKVHPYRADQDLFLESLSYLKLRSVTLGYTFPVGKGEKRSDLHLYVSGNNLFTVSGFSGDDPELVDFDGYYRGYGMGIPRSVTLGVQYKF